MENDRRPGIPSDYLETKRGRSPRDLMNEVAEYLRLFATGSDHPVTEAQIDRDLGLREVVARQIIRKLRKRGYLIASGKRGYWVLSPMPSQEDKTRFLKRLVSLKQRGVKIIRITDPLEESFERKFGPQLSLKNV